jgi:hypothetical protein
MVENIDGVIKTTIKDQAERAMPRSKTGRRSFMRGLGVGAASAVALGARSTGARAQQNLDVAILEFALNLEYLEAQFYSLAATGAQLPASLTGPNPGPVTGGSQVPFTDPFVQATALELAVEETNHVAFLRAALTAATGSAISQPAIDFASSFPTLGSAAGLGSNFNPFANNAQFLLGAYVFEDVGVTAYHGAAPLITNPAYLDRAAGILAVEAYHAGLIRGICFAYGLSSQTAAISNLRATLDGTAGTPNVDDNGIGSADYPAFTNASNYLNGPLLAASPFADNPPGNNAIAYDRTTRQVLNIVYGAPNATKGLFFPNGMNGIITS